MTSEVFGRPIEGEIRQPNEWGNQDDPQNWLKALDAVLAFDDVEWVSWPQYTQYWNDGEETEFDVMCDYAKIKLASKEDVLDADEIFYPYRSQPTVEMDLEIKEAFKNFVDELGSSHYKFLQESFGDHAEVKATRIGFEVEFYQHD